MPLVYLSTNQPCCVFLLYFPLSYIWKGSHLVQLSFPLLTPTKTSPSHAPHPAKVFSSISPSCLLKTGNITSIRLNTTHHPNGAPTPFPSDSPLCPEYVLLRRIMNWIYERWCCPDAGSLFSNHHNLPDDTKTPWTFHNGSGT